MKVSLYCVTALAVLALILPFRGEAEDEGQGSTMMKGGQGMMGGGMMGQGTSGQGMTGQGMMGQGMTGQGMMGQGMTGQGENQNWYCPYCGRSMGMMGQGMMNQGMMGQGMMGKGMMGKGMMGGGMKCSGMMCRGWGYPNQGRVTPVDMAGAKELVEHYLAATGNPRLKAGKITEMKDSFVAEIVTQDGSLVDKIIIDKNTGWMRPEA